MELETMVPDASSKRASPLLMVSIFECVFTCEKKQNKQKQTLQRTQDCETGLNCSFQPEDPYVADLLKMADDKIAELTNEVAVAREERDGTLMKIDSFRKQVQILGDKNVQVLYLADISGLSPDERNIHKFPSFI